MKTTVNILIADDQSLLRKGLRLLIESEEGLSVIGEASDGQEAISRVRELTPDIVVMDINMPNLDGIGATRKILAESPQTKVLALSIHSGKLYVESMLEAGASGYLLKHCAPVELIRAINVLSEGGAYLSPDITGIVLSRLKQAPNPGEVLTAEDPLLTRKLQRPGLASTVVYRSQLIRKLEIGCGKKLTLVAAPGGYGKTTLVSDWLAHCDTPNAWLTADKNDNDLRQFLVSMLASIRSLFPDVCPNVLSLTEAANLPPVSTMGVALTNDLEECPHRFILAIDDFHLIEVKSVHDLFSQLLKNPLPQMHLVLITRRNPFLPLSFLRTNNDMNELRIDDLRFSLQETTTFLERTLDQKIDPVTASRWREQTEGCAADLQLVLTTNQLPDVGDGYTPEGSGMRSERSEGLSDWRDILTNREYEILLLLEQRLSDKEMADQMCISLETVKTHTKNIRVKFNVNSRRAAVSKAISLNILPEN